jgi:hypothetical protein
MAWPQESHHSMGSLRHIFVESELVKYFFVPCVSHPAWVLAESRCTEQDSARQRKRKFAYIVIGTALVGLVCTLAWYFS